MSKNGLLIKLEEISFRYDEVSKLIVDPEIISDMNRYVKLNREYKKVVEGNPDVFNHNIETVPSLYRKVRPGSKYCASLDLLK